MSAKYKLRVTGECKQNMKLCSMRLSQEKANWLRQWILENVSVPIKIVAVGIAEHEPLVENPQTDYERDLNMFVDIRVVRE